MKKQITKRVTPAQSRKNTKEQIRTIAKEHPEQTKQEIFPNIDQDGFNKNPSGQEEYPGVQKHTKLKK